MNFLAPLFLAGLATVALPLWLHLLQTQTPERQPFSSAMLLKMTEQRVHLRRRLRYLALLALRILLFALLALAFSQPIWERPAGAGVNQDARLHMVVIDTSLSMGQGDVFADAIAEARRIVEGLGPADRAQLIAAADAVEILAATPAETPEDRTAVLQALETLRPGAGRLDFGALMSALGELATPGPEPIVMHLVSDFQLSGLPAQFGSLVPRALRNRGQEVVLHPVANAASANWAIEYLRRTPTGLDLGVRGLHSEAKELAVRVTLNDAREERQARPIAASGMVEFSLPLPDVAFATGDNRVVATIDGDDALAADNVRYLVVPNTPAEPVPLLTTRPDAPFVRYISTAFATAARQFRIEPMNIGSFDIRTLQRYSWIAIDDIGAVGPELATALTEYLSNGGGILATAGERVLALDSVPITGQSIGRNAPAEGQSLAIGRVDGSHPLLSATDGWRGITVTRLAPIVPASGDRVLLAMEDQRPLLLERAAGPGKLLLLTTSLDNAWNDLAVSPVFVSFMAETARYLSGEQALNRQQTAGSSLPLSLTGSASGQVVDPSGATILSLADTRRAQDVRLRQTGFYQVYTPGQETLIAVNADPRESDLAPMTAEQLERWRAAAVVPAQQNASAAADSRPPPIELWRFLLIGLVMVVLAESLLANRYLRGNMDGHLHGQAPDAGRAA